MYPERRFYKASQQAQTIPRIRSTAAEDLYLVYEGLNPDTGRPIIKAHLNPLVMWIWVGVWIVIVGTGVALIPNAQAVVRAPAPKLVESPAAVGPGDCFRPAVVRLLHEASCHHQAARHPAHRSLRL